jgi:hypothetical protein
MAFSEFLIVGFVFFKLSRVKDLGEGILKTCNFTLRSSNQPKGFAVWFCKMVINDSHFQPKKAHRVSAGIYEYQPSPLPILAFAVWRMGGHQS